MPLPDEKPQSVEETDQEPEQTHVDALNLYLRHDFSDIFVKLSSGDLSLTVQRNASGEIWSTHPGIHPDEALDQPFGVCWRSGLTAHVKLTFKDLNNPPPACMSEWPEPDYTFVTDENGSSYRFVLMWKDDGPYFLPVPSNRTDQETFLMSLVVLNPTDPMPDWNFRFTKKFGTTLDFVATNLHQSYQTNPDAPVADYQNFFFFRLSSATDRMGNSLSYIGSGDSLIPDSIVGQSGTGLTRSIEITHTGTRVTSITDPRENTTNYTYSAVTVNGNPVDRLVQVSRPEGCYVRYGYEIVTEYDDTPQEPPEQDNYFFHANVNSIEDALGNTYTIQYTFDESRESLTSVSGAGVWYIAPGQPRIVQKVILPDANEALFAQVLSAPLRVLYMWDGMEMVPTINGNRINEVTDAAGKVRRYSYSAPKFVSTKQFEDLFFNPLAGGKPRLQYFLILWQRLDLLHPTSVTETCEFDGDAGMMLKKLTDYSGNITTFEYSDTWNAADALPWLPVGLQTHPYFFTKWSDVTAQVNALSGRKEFTYYSEDPTSPVARIMVGIVDEEERVTEYEINTTNGLRTAEIIMDASLNVVRRTEFSYDDATFPMFMTEKRVIDGVLTSTGLEDLVTVYTPDDYGNVAEEETGGLTSMTYEYDLNGNKTASIDGRSNRTEMEYDGVNRLFMVTFEDTSTKFIGWDARSKKIREDDENGNITRFEYDTLNRLIKSIREMPGTDLITEFTYNQVGSKLTQKDPKGNVTEFAYDDIQRLVLTRDALMNETVLVYGANSGATAFDTSGFKPTEATDARGFRVINTYDELYRLVESQAEYETDVFAVTVNEYDAVGNLIKVTDPLLSETEMEYDALNRPVKVTNPDLTETFTEYAAGEKMVTKATDELGRETTFEYDLAGRQVLVRQPDPVTGLPSVNSPETVSEYDAANNLVAMINPLGNQWDYEYDVRNRRIEELQPAVPDGEQSGNPLERPLIVTAYDYVGNVLSVTDPRGNTTTTEYDEANRPVRVTQPAVLVFGSIYPVVPVTETEYDRNGNVLTVTDAAGNLTENTYDALNRLRTTTTWPEAGVHSIEVEYEYDEVGNRTNQIDGRGCRVEFAYDGLKRLTRTRHDAGTAVQGQVVVEYNALLKVARVDAISRRTEYSYDVRHRLTGVVWVGQMQDEHHMVYDDVGNLLSTTFPNAPSVVRDTASTYDKLNRMLTESSASLIHTYEYDKAGNRTRALISGYFDLVSTYDALNRLETLDENSTQQVEYVRDLAGNLVSKATVGVTSETREHDALNRPKWIRTEDLNTSSLLLEQVYRYDVMGNVRMLQESNPGGTLPDREIVNTYDDIYRLLEEVATTSGVGVITTVYEYDDANNRTSRYVNGGSNPGTSTYVIGTGTNGAGANQILQANLPGFITWNYTYDLNGNRLTRFDGSITDTYSYDFGQRLVNLVRTGPFSPLNYEYTYDTRTRRVVRDESGAGGVRTELSFSGGTYVVETPLGAPWPAHYVRGSDWGGGVGGLLYTERNGVRSFKHANARGDIVASTDGSAVVDWEAHYDAFGQHAVEAGTNVDRQRANTKDEDPTGLLNEGFRYRDLDTGTFITRDPAGFVDGPNLYTYVRQNPWTAWDPKGLRLEVKKEKRIDPKTKREYDHRTITLKAKLVDASSGNTTRAQNGGIAYVKRSKEDMESIRNTLKGALENQWKGTFDKDGNITSTYELKVELEVVASQQDVDMRNDHVIYIVNKIPDVYGLNGKTDPIGTVDELGGRLMALESDSIYTEAIKRAVGHEGGHWFGLFHPRDPLDPKGLNRGNRARPGFAPENPLSIDDVGPLNIMGYEGGTNVTEKQLEEIERLYIGNKLNLQHEKWGGGKPAMNLP